MEARTREKTLANGIWPTKYVQMSKVQQVICQRAGPASGPGRGSGRPRRHTRCAFVPRHSENVKGSSQNTLGSPARSGPFIPSTCTGATPLLRWQQISAPPSHFSGVHAASILGNARIFEHYILCTICEGNATKNSKRAVHCNMVQYEQCKSWKLQ